MEISKDTLFHLAKKLSSKDFSNPLTNIPRINNIFPDSPKKEKYGYKKHIKLKNKYLEKDNIQINEDKMLKLLMEKKRKIKLALNLKNNDNNKIKNIPTPNNSKIIKLNNGKLKDNDNNPIDENINKYIKILKNKSRRNNINIYHNSFSGIHFNSSSSGINLNSINEQRKIYNSNSDYYNMNNSNHLFVPNKKIIRSNLSYLNTDMNIYNINYSRNKEEINLNNNPSLKLYSTKRINKHNITDINMDICNETNKIINNVENNMNNNISINISINSNGLNNKKIGKSTRNPPKAHRKRMNPKLNKNTIIRKIPTYTNFNKNNNIDIEHKRKELIIPSSAKINKKHISYKYQNINHKNNYLKKYSKENEEEKDDNNNNIQSEKKYEYYNEDKYNIYNINLNFISDKRKNVDYHHTDDNERHFNQNNNNILKQKMKNTTYKNSGQNNQLYSVIMTNGSKNFFENKIGSIIKRNNSVNKIKNSHSITEIEYDYNYDYNNAFEGQIQITPMKKINNKHDIIQLEDLLIIEGKLYHLLNCIKNNKVLSKMCVELWGFYTYSSFYGKFPKLFPKISKKKNSDYEIAHDAIILGLLSLIVTYEILNYSQNNEHIMNILIDLINQLHQNFLIECDYILFKVNVNIQSIKNIWIKKLRDLINIKKNWNQKNILHLNLIKNGNFKMSNYINDILNKYSENNFNSYKINLSTLKYFNENISNLHLIQLSEYFNKKINKEKAKINNTFSYVVKNKLYVYKNEHDIKNKIVKVPYLPKKGQGNIIYTLVLDLDETLINFRFNNKNEGIFKTRPGLYDFLKNVGKKYEIVIFTAGTQEYADPILDIIEKDNKYFVKRLYRQHTVFIDNIFVKDLTKLGRDLSKIIIVDNMPQNFCLQKENSILIKNYFGQDDEDKALFDLEHILLEIASKSNNDVRTELKKFREEIFSKITIDLY